MKKIMFNDRYGLTEAVLSGRKTQTRRIIKRSHLFESDRSGMWTDSEIKDWEASRIFDTDFEDDEDREYAFEWLIAHAPYKVGDTVAVAQSYKTAGVKFIPHEDEEFGCIDFPAHQLNGWNNKMFVRSDLMPERIRITKVRVERLQDISDEDCINEGVEFWSCRDKGYFGIFDKVKGCSSRHDTPRNAFSDLIDKVSGKGTWESNPYVFVYDFEKEKGGEG